MSNINGVVISKQVDVEIKGFNKTYKGYRVVYQTPEGEVKTLEKAMQSLKYNPTIEAQLVQVTVGQPFTAYLEKNDKGFLDVKSFTVGEFNEAIPNEAPAPKAEQGGSVPQRSGYTVPARTGNTYETPEERAIRRQFEAQKQRLIVRQAAINAAISAGYDISHEDELFAFAKRAEAFVYDGIEINV